MIVVESDAFAKATSIEPEIGPAHILSSRPREEPKTLECVDALTAPEPPTEPLDRRAPRDRALPQYPCGRVIYEDGHGAETVASPPSATTPPPPPQSEARTPILEEDEWEVRRVVGKRRVGKGF